MCIRDILLCVMEWVDVISLGLIQGITEFLPISSTGHLVLARALLSIGDVDGLAFDAMLHFATTAAIVCYFRSEIWNLLQVALRTLSRQPVNQRDATLLYALLIGTLPGVVLGLLLESFIDAHFRIPVVVASVLFGTALFFMYTEWCYYMRSAKKELTVRTGLLVGLFQALALLPGMSRSGSTIAGGMLLGMTRYESSRFSFLLSIPITLGVGAKKTIDLMQEGVVVQWSQIGVGALVAFVTALIVIHFFLTFIRKYTLWPFVWYSILLSGAVWYVHFFA